MPNHDCSNAHFVSFLFHYNCTQRTGQMERDKCSLLLCVGILVGSFWKMSYALICWLSIWAYGNNGYGEEVRWSCSDKNRHGISFYKMSIFHHLVTFHISQVWKSLFGKNRPKFCWFTVIPHKNIFDLVSQRLKLHNWHCFDKGEGWN